MTKERLCRAGAVTLGFVFLSIVVLADQPVYKGVLQSDLNANGHSITNVASLTDTNGNPIVGGGGGANFSGIPDNYIVGASNGAAIPIAIGSGLGFNPSTRTLSAAQLTLFSVVTAGADPTGVADSSSAFNAGQTNAVLYVPAGRYSVTNVTFTNNITVFGDGVSSIIKQPLSTTGYIFTTSSGKFANFRDLALDGGITTNSLYDPGVFYSHGTLGTKHGISLNCSGYPTVKGVYFFNFNGYGIDVGGGGDIYYRTNFYTVQYCTFTNNFTGIHCGDNNTSEYGQLVGNFFLRNYCHLDLQSANIQVVGNEGHDAHFSVYLHPFLNGRSHSQIVGNLFHHSTYQFQVENATTGCLIADNSFMAGLGTPGVATNGGSWLVGYVNPGCNNVQVKNNHFETAIDIVDFSTGTNLYTGNTWFSDGGGAFVTPTNSVGISYGKFGFTNCVEWNNFLMGAGPQWLNPRNATNYVFNTGFTLTSISVTGTGTNQLGDVWGTNSFRVDKGLIMAPSGASSIPLAPPTAGASMWWPSNDGSIYVIMSTNGGGGTSVAWTSTNKWR